MRTKTLLALLSLLVVAMPAAHAAPVTALRGATLVDLGAFGRSTQDVRDSIVLIEGERILAAGAAAEIAIPEGASVIDVSGKYLVPGLIDAFSVQNNENQARAHLYMGVTTVFAGVRDSRRGPSMPAPLGPALMDTGMVLGRDMRDMMHLETVGELIANAPALTPAQIESQVDAQRWDDYRATLLYYTLSPEQTAAAARRSRAQKLIAIGEMGHTGVLEAARLGVPLFVHMNRYLIDVAPPAVRKAVADDPFGPGRIEYMRFLRGLDPASPALRDFAIALAAEPVALMPTLALIYLSLPDHANPWKEPVATLIDAADIMGPADPETGEAPLRGGTLVQAQEAALHLIALQRALAQHGVKFVLGSGADAFGVLPGLGAHIELELLVRIGLTPREALAAGTTNLSSLLDFVDYGVIRPGARADLLLLDADPTQDIRHVRRIARLFVRGVEIDRPALLTRVEPTPPD